MEIANSLRLIGICSNIDVDPNAHRPLVTGSECALTLGRTWEGLKNDFDCCLCDPWRTLAKKPVSKYEDSEVTMAGNTRTVISDRGFSLVELMVTVGILMVILHVTTNLMVNVTSWLAHHRLRSAARELYFTMQKGRMSAIRDNRDWAIVFDPGHAPNRYYLCSDRGADASWSNLADNTIVQTVNLSAYQNGIGFGHGNATKNATVDGGPDFPDDHVSFNNNVVTFNPGGRPTTSGYSYLSNEQGEAYVVGATNSGSIVVRRWTGDAQKPWQ